MRGPQDGVQAEDVVVVAVAQDDEVRDGAAGVEVVVDEGADVPLAGAG